MSDLRRLRTGTHRSGNIYFADTPQGVDDDHGQLGYVRDGRYAKAMVEAFNTALPLPALAQAALTGAVYEHANHLGGYRFEQCPHLPCSIFTEEARTASGGVSLD
jgi:hypothetical protein